MRRSVSRTRASLATEYAAIDASAPAQPPEAGRVGVRRVVTREANGREARITVSPGEFGCARLVAELADEWVELAGTTGFSACSNRHYRQAIRTSLRTWMPRYPLPGQPCWPAGSRMCTTRSPPGCACCPPGSPPALGCRAGSSVGCGSWWGAASPILAGRSMCGWRTGWKARWGCAAARSGVGASRRSAQDPGVGTAVARRPAGEREPFSLGTHCRCPLGRRPPRCAWPVWAIVPRRRAMTPQALKGPLLAIRSPHCLGESRPRPDRAPGHGARATGRPACPAPARGYGG